MQLKEDQWYQLPNGQWAKAIGVDDPRGPILMVYGVDLASADGYKRLSDIYVEPGLLGRLGVTGKMTWETWTVRDLREATPDEAETQTLRTIGPVKT